MENKKERRVRNTEVTQRILKLLDSGNRNRINDLLKFLKTKEKKYHLSFAGFSAIRQGRYDFSINHLAGMSEYFGVSIEWLITGIEKNEYIEKYFTKKIVDLENKITELDKQNKAFNKIFSEIGKHIPKVKRYNFIKISQDEITNNLRKGRKNFRYGRVGVTLDYEYNHARNILTNLNLIPDENTEAEFFKPVTRSISKIISTGIQKKVHTGLYTETFKNLLYEKWNTDDTYRLTFNDITNFITDNFDVYTSILRDNSNEEIESAPTKTYSIYERAIKLLIKESELAYNDNNLPDGAVICGKNSEIIASSRYSGISERHAIIKCIKQALADNHDLRGSILFTTTLPCSYCIDYIKKTHKDFNTLFSEIYIADVNTFQYQKEKSIDLVKNGAIQKIYDLNIDVCQMYLNEFTETIRNKNYYTENISIIVGDKQIPVEFTFGKYSNNKLSNIKIEVKQLEQFQQLYQLKRKFLDIFSIMAPITLKEVTTGELNKNLGAIDSFHPFGEVTSEKNELPVDCRKINSVFDFILKYNKEKLSWTGGKYLVKTL